MHAHEYYISIPTIVDKIYSYNINTHSCIRTKEILKQKCIKFLLDFVLRLPTYQTWYLFNIRIKHDMACSNRVGNISKFFII